MNNSGHKKEIALSVDVEDGISIAMRDVFGKIIPQTDRVVSNTERILTLLEKHDAKATFFTLGQVAEHYPALVKKIHDLGHEIGVHGYDHYRFDRMDIDLARNQLSRAKALLEDITGAAVIGHRAPAFSVNGQTKWALPLLAELGFRYDSSIMPCRAMHYGWPEFPKNVTEILFGNGSVMYEIPMSTIQLGTREIPCLGGSYFRLLPYSATQCAINRIVKRNYPVFYMHPYETDPERYPEYYFKELDNVSFFTRLKMKSMWLGRKHVLQKMNRMLEQYETITMGKLLGKEISNGEIKMKEYESVAN